MLFGRIIAEAAMLEDNNVTYIRSYGAEMRGGTAYCLVKISKKDIASPVFEKANVSVIMNRPSLEKFKNRFEQKAVVIANSSLIRERPKIKDVFVYYYPFNDMANSLGDIRAANMIALGTLLRTHQLVTKTTVISVLKDHFKNASHVLEMNLKAFDAGWNMKR